MAEWSAFVKNPKYNLVEKCLKLAQLLEYPNLSVDKYINELTRIGKSLKESMTDVKNPTYLISMLNEHLFENQGFSGDEEDYYNPKNNFLNDVLDKKSGLPITLSIIYCEIAKYIGLKLDIVGFPNHVLVKYGEEMILDPFNDGRLMTAEDLQELLDRSFDGLLELSPEFLNEISTEMILSRLARNAKNSYIQSYAYDKAMRCIDMILALEPDSPEDIRDKGILEERLLHHDSALVLLNKYLELNPNAEDVDFILELMKSIRDKSSQ